MTVYTQPIKEAVCACNLPVTVVCVSVCSMCMCCVRDKKTKQNKTHSRAVCVYACRDS